MVSLFLTPFSFKLSHTTTDLFYRAKAAENVMQKEVERLKKTVALKDAQIKELEATEGV